MTSWRDRLNRMAGRTRFVVCRLFIHLAGEDAAPMLGILNEEGRRAVAADGDMEVLGESLANIAQALLQYDTYWRSVANEGDVFWEEGQAGDEFNALYTDSARRYLSGPDLEAATLPADKPLALPVTRNLVVMITVAFEGECPELETDLSSAEALSKGIQALINLHYNGRLRSLQVHFSPAQLGDELTSDQLLVNFPELVPI
ncbi:MAG: DUF1517 domain-containing protein [Aphanocapsa lilacina HA4352-LM1]|nr:DUF1517 domain-containing protein [Aphanocapsa lilacina HA4352-LM1]